MQLRRGCKLGDLLVFYKWLQLILSVGKDGSRAFSCAEMYFESDVIALRYGFSSIVLL